MTSFSNTLLMYYVSKCMHRVQSLLPVKIVATGQDSTELQSYVHSKVLWTTAKEKFCILSGNARIQLRWCGKFYYSHMWNFFTIKTIQKSFNISQNYSQVQNVTFLWSTVYIQTVEGKKYTWARRSLHPTRDIDLISCFLQSSGVWQTYT